MPKGLWTTVLANEERRGLHRARPLRNPVMQRVGWKGLLRAALTAWILVHSAKPATACPNCKEAVSLQQGEVANLSDGYNWSVLFMLAVPFSLLGTGALMVHRAVKRGSLPEM
jgi:hypothetical protein